MLINSLPAALLLALTAPLAAQEGSAHEGWHEDFDVAVAAAKESGKDLLVDFTGSDWCPPCKALTGEVLSKASFIEEASKHFELVALDFPNSPEVKAKVPNPERNQELSQQYEISGFPTVLAMTADGLVYGRTVGYGGDGQEAFLAMMTEWRNVGKAKIKTAMELADKFENASEEERAGLLGQILDTLEGASTDDPAVGLLAPAVESFLEDGALDEATEIRVIRTMLSIGRANQDLLDRAEEIDPENEQGLFEYVVSNQFQNVRDDKTATAALNALDSVLEMGFKDQDLQKKLLVQSAAWCSGPLSDSDRAKKYAKLAQPLLGEGDTREKQLIEQILNG